MGLDYREADNLSHSVPRKDKSCNLIINLIS